MKSSNLKLDFPYNLFFSIEIEEEIICNKEYTQYSIEENLFLKKTWLCNLICRIFKIEFTE